MDKLIKDEMAYVKNIVAQLKKNGVQAIILQEIFGVQVLSDTAKQWLDRTSIVVFKPFKKEQVQVFIGNYNGNIVQIFRDFLGVTPISGVEQLADAAFMKQNIAIVDHLYPLQVGKKKLLILRHDQARFVQ